MNKNKITERLSSDTSTLLSLPYKVLDIYTWAMRSHDEMLIDSALYALDVMKDSECESPIEQIFLYTFAMCIYGERYAQSAWLEEQKWITTDGGSRCRADFYFTTEGRDVFTDCGETAMFKNKLNLVVECDGHEFHEKTKEQVKHDNERDFELKSSGYEVLHFSGSQIYNSPFKCARDVLDFILKKTGELEVVDGDIQKRPNSILDGHKGQ